jgi:CRISPR/Cas system-associated exonuclease Cas4 (RecB family)
MKEFNVLSKNMEIIRDIIIPAWSDEKTIFVFPSEVAARQMQKKALAASGLKISKNRQFISWDQFKEQSLDYETIKKPSNKYLRTLFIEQLLAENKKSKLFRSLVRPEYADNSGTYLNSLSSFLPVLYRLENIKNLITGVIDPGRFEDLSLLFSRYKSFLTKNKIYEPDYETPRFKANGKHYLIFFPEIIQDFERIKPLLPSQSQVWFVAVSAFPQSKTPEISVFPNTISEVKWTLLEIAALCDRGVAPEEIVLTVAAPERIASFLNEQANLLNIPLSLHYGKPLSSYPGVNFLSQLKSVYTSGFALGEMKTLIFNRSLSWKQQQLAEELIRFGTVYNCFKNYFDGKREIDSWEFNLKRLKQSKEYSSSELNALLYFYRHLKICIVSINEAPGFRELKRAVDDFSSAFFTSHALGEDIIFYYEYAQRILTELMQNHDCVDLPAPESAFNLWLITLADTRYVKPESEGGIAVYPYRVAAGIQPQYHFIINASQQNTQYIIKKYPFLHLDEETFLKQADLDLSDPYVDLYGYSGTEVNLSYARRDFSDSHLPPGFFIARGVIRERQIEAETKVRHPFWQELTLWATHNTAKSITFSPLQKQGFFKALATVLAPKPKDFTRSAIKDKTLSQALNQKLPHEQGRLRISPTSLELFSNCAFTFLLTQALELSIPLYEPEILDARWVGDIIHRIFQLFFKELYSEEGVFKPENTAAYREMMSEALMVVENYFQLSEPLPLKPAWECLKQGISENCGRFLTAEAQAFPDYQVLHIEHTAGLDWKEPAAALRGKIDRISQKNDYHIIIDYKKKGVPLKKDIFNEQGNPCSFQMPFYYYLLTEQGLKVRSASYYSFEKGSYIHVLNPDDPRAYAKIEDIAPAIAIMKQGIINMIESIRQGDFSIKQEGTPRCSGCELRGVCRNNFVLG